MARPEVEAIFGPSGDYATAPLEDPDPSGLFMSHWRPYYAPLTDRVGGDHAIRQWRTDAGIACVAFSRSGHVVSAGMWPVKRVEQTAIDNLVWRAKRPWRRWFSE
jgi:hypothetical protein